MLPQLITAFGFSALAAAANPNVTLLISGLSIDNIDAKTGSFNYTFLWADLGTPETIGSGFGNSVDINSNTYTNVNPYTGGLTGGDVFSLPSLSVSNWIQPISPFVGNFQVKAKNYYAALCDPNQSEYAGSFNVTTGQTQAPPTSYATLYFPPFEINMEYTGTAPSGNRC